MSTESIHFSQTLSRPEVAHRDATNNAKLLVLLFIIGFVAVAAAVVGVVSQNYWLTITVGLVASVSIYSLVLRYVLA